MKRVINQIIGIILIFILNVGFAYGQILGAGISGRLTSDKGTDLSYATVTLLKAIDTSVIQNSLSNDTGYYSFSHVRPGSYVIRVTTLGYKPFKSDPFSVNPGTILSLPVFKIAVDNQVLNTVTISSSRPMIESNGDHTVMNVENSIVAAGNSALEILARAPGVSIDQNDNISLNGKSGVTVMINDKLTYLSATQLATLLRSTDGSTIKSIELTTNPSAKYDASGNSGIINIKLKKNTQSGTNGTVILSAGYGKYGKDRSTLSLNHKTGHLNIFGTISHDDDKTANTASLKRIMTDSTGNKTFFNQLTSAKDRSADNGYRLGAEYDVTHNNAIGIQVNGYFNGETDRNNDPTYIGNQPGSINSYQNTQSVVDQHFQNFAVNLNDKLKLDTNGQELRLDADYSKFNNNSEAQYNTYFYLPDGSGAASPQFLREQTPSQIDIRSAKVDYMLPLTKTFKIEAGAKFSDVKTDNDLLAQQQNGKTYVNDSTLSNRFIYDEKIAAAYFNMNKSLKHTTIQAGLRAEHTSSSGDLLTTNQLVSRGYLDFFPSVFIDQQVNDKNDIGFSYSRRIDRPGYDDLNPFVYYIDQYTYTKGNPFLNPQYTNSFALNYRYNHLINVSLNYSHTADAISGALLTDASNEITIQTKLNLQSQDHYALTANALYTITSWWTGNVNGVLFYNRFKSDSLLGSVYNRGQLSFQGRATQYFKLGNTYKAELTSSYQTALTYGIYQVRPAYSNDIGISHSFAGKKATLKFSISDIFNTVHDQVSSVYQSNNLLISQKPESRIGRLTFTWNFGNKKIKTDQHQAGDGDEKSRVKGAN